MAEVIGRVPIEKEEVIKKTRSTESAEQLATRFFKKIKDARTSKLEKYAQIKKSQHSHFFKICTDELTTLSRLERILNREQRNLSRLRQISENNKKLLEDLKFHYFSDAAHDYFNFLQRMWLVVISCLDQLLDRNADEKSLVSFLRITDIAEYNRRDKSYHRDEFERRMAQLDSVLSIEKHVVTSYEADIREMIKKMEILRRGFEEGESQTLDQETLESIDHFTLITAQVLSMTRRLN